MNELRVAVRGSDEWRDAMRRQSAEVFRDTFQAFGFFEKTQILGPVDGDTTTLFVYDFIDWLGVDAVGFADALSQVETPDVLVRINSPGGDVFDGIAIHNLLRSSSKNVTVRVDGIAASIASVIAMGSDTREIAVGAQFMVHDPWAVAAGNAADMRAFSELLDKQGDNLAAVYAARTSDGTAEEWRARMLDGGAGTWFTDEESVAAGLATAVADDDDKSVAAKAALTVLPAAAAADTVSSDPRGSGGDGERSAGNERAMRVANARKAIRAITNGAKV